MTLDKFAGARHSRSDAADMQALHEIAVRQGATCAEDGKEKMTAQVDCYLIENYIATRPGDPYLWLPYGTIRKGDKTREVTRELAAQFKLPHFKPPIKLGSHDDATPAGGHIARFELRDDGIWVFPEMVESGSKAIAEGAYRYHSPEIIWQDGYMQDPVTGEHVPGPFIMGDALLHTPHLGERAALYTSVVINERNKDMTEQMVSVPSNLWDKFMAMFEKQVNPPTPTGDSPEVTKLKAQASEAEKYKAELEALKAQATKAQELSAMAVELQNAEHYGALFTEAKVAQTAAEHFSAMPKESREWAQKQIRALVAQTNDAETIKKFGKGANAQGGAGASATEQFNAEILRVSAEQKVDYNRAVQIVAQTKPELYAAYKADKG